MYEIAQYDVKYITLTTYAPELWSASLLQCYKPPTVSLTWVEVLELNIQI